MNHHHPFLLLVHDDYNHQHQRHLMPAMTTRTSSRHHQHQHRQLEDYYAYPKDTPKKNQHPVMTFLLLVILSILVISSFVVFIIRCYRKRFKDDCGDLAPTDCPLPLAAIENMSSTASSTGSGIPITQEPPSWAQAAEASAGYVEMTSNTSIAGSSKGGSTGGNGGGGTPV